MGVVPAFWTYTDVSLGTLLLLRTIHRCLTFMLPPTLLSPAPNFFLEIHPPMSAGLTSSSRGDGPALISPLPPSPARVTPDHLPYGD